LQAAAIEEAKQNARDNPIAAAAVTAAISGGNVPQAAQTNTENLLDIDFDGAAPASMQKAPVAGASGLEGLAGTPQRVASPTPNSGGGMDDLMGLFGNSNGMSGGGMNGNMSNDLMNGFASMDVNGGQPPPPQAQMDGGGDKKTKEDLLGLF
jgi:hypothetical protein